MPPAGTRPSFVLLHTHTAALTAAMVAAGLALTACGGGSNAGGTGEVGAAPLKVDTTYGASGTVTLHLGTPWSATLGVQADGKVLVANTKVIAPIPSPNAGGLPTQQPVVTRLGTDGAVDRAFGQNGEVRFTVKGSDSTVSVQPQANGRILMAVMAHEPCTIRSFQEQCLTASGVTDTWHYTVVGLTPAGMLDSSFGAQGIAEGFRVPLMYPLHMAVQADQKLLLLTSTDLVPMQVFGRRVRRLSADGSPDVAFNQEHAEQTAPPCAASGHAILPLPNGSIITAGALGNRVYETPTADPGLCIAVHAGGTQAQTSGGWFSFGETLKEYQLQPHADGGFAIAARTCGVSICRLSIARFRADGTVNPSFGDRGIARVAVPAQYSLKSFFTQPDGAMVTFGAAAEGPVPSGPGSRYRAVWAGLKADGSPDTRFGAQGVTVQALADAEPLVVLTDGAGRWLAASTAWDAAGNAALKIERTTGTSARNP